MPNELQTVSRSTTSQKLIKGDTKPKLNFSEQHIQNLLEAMNDIPWTHCENWHYTMEQESAASDYNKNLQEPSKLHATTKYKNILSTRHFPGITLWKLYKEPLWSSNYILLFFWVDFYPNEARGGTPRTRMGASKISKQMHVLGSK